MQTPIPVHDDIAWHFMWVVLPVVAATLLGQLVTFLANRKRGQEKDNALATLLNEYRLHDHGEWKDENSKGTLNAENMRFPRSGDH